MRHILSAVALIVMPLTALQAQPAMDRAEAMSLYKAGGFPIAPDGSSPLNRCGKPAKPRITFVDINGDRRKEALFIDQGACYAPDNRWFSIATRGADGQWRGIAGQAGTVKAVGTMTGGWFDMQVTSRGASHILRYDGSRYSDGTPATDASAAKPAPAPATSASTPALTGDAAIFAAAGFKRHGKIWKSGCDDPGTPSYSPGEIVRPGDLNGDGRPEAVVNEGGTYCYGFAGNGFHLVSQQADGSWRLIHTAIGYPEFLKTKGVGGWPDISVGGPGFCFPVLRWNGSKYVLHRKEYQGKRCG